MYSISLTPLQGIHPTLPPHSPGGYHALVGLVATSTPPRLQLPGGIYRPPRVSAPCIYKPGRVAFLPKPYFQLPRFHPNSSFHFIYLHHSRMSAARSNEYYNSYHGSRRSPQAGELQTGGFFQSDSGGQNIVLPPITTVFPTSLFSGLFLQCSDTSGTHSSFYQRVRTVASTTVSHGLQLARLVGITTQIRWCTPPTRRQFVSNSLRLSVSASFSTLTSSFDELPLRSRLLRLFSVQYTHDA